MEAVVTLTQAILVPLLTHQIAIKPCISMLLESSFDALIGPVSERAAKPLPLRCLYWPLGRFHHRCCHQLACNVSQELLARAILDFAFKRLSKRQFKQTVIEERFAQLDRGTHGNAVIEPQRLGNFGVARVGVLAIAQRVREGSRRNEGFCQTAEIWQ